MRLVSGASSAAVLAVVVILGGSRADAELIDSDPAGFTIAHEVLVHADPDKVWKAAVEGIGSWWDDSHTIGGNAATMYIDARPMGCFCESLGGDGGVVHMTVTFVNPKVMLRLTGGLGPLGLMGVSGNMTWEFFDDDGGTRVRFTYAVGGYRPGGLDEIAVPVDKVIGEALQRLRSYAETGGVE